MKHYLLLMTILDPDTGAMRNVMATWNEKDWVLTSQSVSLTYIATQEIASKLYAWGTDGSSIYPLFAQPSIALSKRIDTKYYGADSQFLLKDLVSVQIVAQDQSVDLAGVSGSLSFVVSMPVQPGGLTARQQSFQPGGSSVLPGSAVVIAPDLSFQAPILSGPSGRRARSASRSIRSACGSRRRRRILFSGTCFWAMFRQRS